MNERAWTPESRPSSGRARRTGAAPSSSFAPASASAIRASNGFGDGRCKYLCLRRYWLE